MARKKKPAATAQLIGYGLAHLQDGIDQVVSWGFGKLNEAGEVKLPKRKKKENKYLYASKKLGLGALGFCGTVGSAFYNKYEELKAEEAKEK